MDLTVNYLDQIPPEILCIILRMVTYKMSNITAIRCLSNTFNTIFENRIKQTAFGIIDSNQLKRYLESSEQSKVSIYDITTDLSLCSECTNAILMKFTNLRQLNTLDFLACSVSLQHMTKLTHLVLRSHHDITDKSIEKLTKLRVLICYANSEYITDNSIKLLTNLTVLIIGRNSPITDNGIAALTRLTALGLNKNISITNNGLAHLQHLNTISLGYNGNITNDGISHLSKLNSLFLSESSTCKLTPDMTNLTSLHLIGNGLYTDDMLCSFTQLKHLTIVSNNPFKATTLSLLTNLTSLMCPCADYEMRQSYKQLTHLTKLTKMNLDS